MILWAGIGQGLAIAVAALAAFFLMFYNAYFGIREVSQTLIDQVLIAAGRGGTSRYESVCRRPWSGSWPQPSSPYRTLWWAWWSPSS